MSLVLGKLYENNIKIKKKCYMTKHTLKRVILIGNPYLVPRLNNNEIWTKRIGDFGLGQSIRNCMKFKEKYYLTKLSSMRVISTRNLLFHPMIR